MMRFRTEIDIPKADFEIGAAERMLFVGSCFADNLGRRFVENRFRATVNPFGVMYNPASILHTVEKCSEVRPRVAVFTLGTNHVYILKETGEIVDNCQKRPQRLFTTFPFYGLFCQPILLARMVWDIRIFTLYSPFVEGWQNIGCPKSQSAL